jgi:hypothetical protein
MHYIFAGRTRPDGVAVKFDVQNPPLKLAVSGIEGQTCQVSLLLSGGIYIALAVEAEASITDIATFRNQMTTICQSIYQAASFLNGRYLSVELTSLTEIETHRFWTFSDEVLELQSTTHERPVPIEELTKRAVENVYLRSALSDLSSAIASPNDTGFYCYRAIEVLMQEFKQSGETDSRKAWPRFRDALQVTESWIKPLTDHSASNRHGELKGLSGQERVFLMQSAWTLVYRLACLRLRGIATLPTSEFPLLDAAQAPAR